MKNPKLDQRLITGMILEEIKKNNIPIKVDPPQVQPLQIQEKKKKLYEPAPVSVFDAFTLCMFVLNIIGMANFNWFIVFLPIAFPYIVVGCAWCISKIIIKIKSKKNNKTKELNESKVN
jgi:hypothetical protein